VIAYALGLRTPTDYRYFQLVNKLQGGTTPAALTTLKDGHLNDAVWLHYQMRQYRNAFVEHVERPWQRGSSMGVYGEDFNFFITTPVGWLSDEHVERLIAGIRQFAPAWVDRLPADSWQRKPRAVLEATYREIDQIPRQVDREKVWDIWSQIGGSTVSYDVLVRRLVTFMQGSTATVLEQIKASPETINFGLPSSATEVVKTDKS
jgi:hypothetical protein